MLRSVFALLALLALAACTRQPEPHEHTPAAHAHAAPHGGTLVELGDHAYNVEFVRDAAAGKLTAYILDGHAENFVRIKSPSFAVNLQFGADTRGLLLRAVANSATGETVGDTAQFEATADWLKSAAALEAVIPTLEIHGARFENVAFRLPAAD